MSEEEAKQFKGPIEKKYEEEGHPYFASARWVLVVEYSNYSLSDFSFC